VKANNALPDGQTELVLDSVLKAHAALKGRKSVLTPRYLDTKEKLLVAMEIHKGEIEAYEGVALDAKGAVLKYVRGALQLKDKSTAARLRYNIDFLDDADDQVAQSARVELNSAKYAALRKVAETLKPEPFAKALASEDLAEANRGPLAMLLAHCGTKEHAALVRKILDRADEKASSSDATLFFAYVLLDRGAGWDYLTKNSVQADNSFLRRYSALRALRQLSEERKDIVPEKKWADATVSILKLADMADFAIEDLRKGKCWEQCDAVLDLVGQKQYDVPIVRRSMLRYALQCPSPRAKAYVNEVRGRDPEYVKDTQEVLDLDSQ
jgi:hypothetical protein